MNRRRDPQAEVDLFNAAVKVGQFVDYRELKGEGKILRTRTRTEAQVLSGHTAVVWLEGKSGCVDVTHCTPVDPMEIDILTSDHYVTLIIEGHVNLAAAEARAHAENHEGYPPFKHAYWRYTKPPKDESSEFDTWREPCAETDNGAEPVTYTQKDW